MARKKQQQRGRKEEEVQRGQGGGPAIGGGLTRSLLFLSMLGLSTGAVIYIAHAAMEGKEPTGRVLGGEDARSVPAIRAHLRQHVPPYLLASVPFFFLLMIAEHMLAKFDAPPAGKEQASKPSPSRSLLSEGGQYRLADGLTSVAAGVWEQLSDTFLLHPLPYSVVPYAVIHEQFRLVDCTAITTETPWIHKVAIYAAAFVLTDLAYYIWHRAAHEVNWIWCAHVVHHSAEGFNYTTALRQSVLQHLTSVPFYMPLALFFPIEVWATVKALQTLGQFWVHTTLIRRMPWIIELVMNTASHHRCHHDRRVHCNYAGCLIIWDRMFGTFKDEREGWGVGADGRPRQPSPSDGLALAYVNHEAGGEHVVYGILTGPNSFNPLVVQFGTLWNMLRQALREMKGWAHGYWFGPFRAVWKGPGSRRIKRKYVPPVSTVVPRVRYVSHVQGPLVTVYTCVHAVLTLVVATMLLAATANLPQPMIWALGGNVMGYFVAMGFMFDGYHSIAQFMELCRHSLLLACSVAVLRAWCDAHNSAGSIFGVCDASWWSLVAPDINVQLGATGSTLLGGLMHASAAQLATCLSFTSALSICCLLVSANSFVRARPEHVATHTKTE